MIISKNLQRFFFGAVVDDIFKRYMQFKIPDYKWEDGTALVLNKYEDYEDADKLRWYLKIFDPNFPKDSEGHPLSMAVVDTDVVLKHIEYMNYVLVNNGSCLAVYDEEWKRLIEQYNR
jgi:hypothetical protein